MKRVAVAAFAAVVLALGSIGLVIASSEDARSLDGAPTFAPLPGPMGPIGPPLPTGGAPVQRNGAVSQVSFERGTSCAVSLSHVGINTDKGRKYTFSGLNGTSWAEATYDLTWGAVWVPDTNPAVILDKLKITFTAETDTILTNSTNMKFETLVKKTVGSKTYWAVTYREAAVTLREVRFIVDATHPDADAHADARMLANVLKQSWPAAGKAHLKTTDPAKTQFEFWFDLPLGINFTP